MTDFWKSLSESLSSIFASSDSGRQGLSPSSSNRGGGSMDASADGNLSVVPNERTAGKLKGYFDLATEEINKAVRAEEWGLPEDAVTHYTNALAILSEAKMTWTPSTITPSLWVPLVFSSEQRKVEVYRGKITQWYQTVEERLQVLGRREQASTSSKKTPLYQPTRRAQKVSLPESAAPYRQNLRKDTPIAGNRRSNPGSPKPNQTSGNNYDDKLVDMINTAIVDRSPAVKWDDVAGLEKAKQALMEMVILPTKRRDLFTGLRKPARGLLLFGPPGNGKTMLAKAVASESQATFFNVSASSLTSKWVGEAEKLVRTLFSVAISRQPSVIFMDEIDSVMSTRTANENEASRRLKSEFLVQFDGVTSNSNDLVIVIGATNKPQELDDAVLRRLVKRIYVPLPDENVRRLLLRNQLKGQSFSLPGSVIERIVTETEGYSGSDLQALCEEAAMMPIRELGSRILTINANQVRSLKHDDFRKAMTVIRPSLQRSRWEELEEWNREFGSN